jgi:2-C-methyl-D-erythritol 2,4-cyclodiphosphate synthase
MADLDELFGRLKTEIEAQLGHKVYSRPLNSEQGWGLYAGGGHSGNFGYVWKRVRSDCLLSHSPLPHLRVAVKNELAARAGVIPDIVKENAWWGNASAFWCVPEGDDEKLKKVASYLAEVYRVSPAERFRPTEMTMRVGIGYDIHPLERGRRLILGGVEIPYEYGLKGHSDGDVLLHAVCDALLGAAGMKDIGYHFPNTDQHYKGISSLFLLERVYNLLGQKNFKMSNLDAVIVAQEPKLSSYLDQMKSNIAKILKVKLDQVGIKTTTQEGLGPIGQCQGMAAWAIVSMEKG